MFDPKFSGRGTERDRKLGQRSKKIQGYLKADDPIRLSDPKTFDQTLYNIVIFITYPSRENIERTLYLARVYTLIT
jgi:hypothetical protein